jgi:biotin transport system permease protein
MAQRIVLHYLPGDSFLHRWDARCKFLGLLMVSATLLRTHIPWLLLNSLLLACLLIFSRLPLRRFLGDLRTWAIFMLALFLFQALFTPGPSPSSLPWVPASQEGLLAGAFMIWRLGLMLGYAVLFTAVTRHRELQDAVMWLLRPVPFIPARRIGLMVSLTLRFFSIILDEAEEVHLAHKSRRGDRIRNPFRRARTLGLPILRRALLRAEDVTLALSARGYREDLPLRLGRFPVSHLLPLLILGCLLLLAEILHLP